MHVFWQQGEQSAQAVRDLLAREGIDVAYVTVANLVRALSDKGFLTQVNDERPFLYRPARTYEDVSGRLLGDLVDRVFKGSRAQRVRGRTQRTHDLWVAIDGDRQSRAP